MFVLAQPAAFAGGWLTSAMAGAVLSMLTAVIVSVDVLSAKSRHVPVAC